MTPLALAVDHDRAKWVTDTLLDAWRRKLPPFDRVTPVPSRLPNNLVRGGREEANYYIVACYQMRGKINSATALVKLSFLHEQRPELFEPRNFSKLGRKRLRALEATIRVSLQDAGLGFNAKETARFWVINFQKLARFWDGNPLLWFEDASWDKLCNILMKGKGDPNSPTGFLGFRFKMVGMYIYFLSRVGIVSSFAFPGVIDFHNDRIGLSTGIIFGERVKVGEEFTFDELAALMREVFQTHARDPETTIELADAIWHLSREFCRKNPGNSSSVAPKYEARRTGITPRDIKWNESSIAIYNSSCGLCPLENVCMFSIPSADNYVRGKIPIRMERPKPHASQLPLLEVERKLERRPPKPPRVVPVDVKHQDQTLIFD